ncbi:MAG: uroporphyrinogen-III C-methyltransferase [Gammaproteobacteria bacterium]|nr:uroporphyrinogen-III C-methyltransferase [Gammaproteobacteria bacterium]
MTTKGFVSLVGSGPGDPELLTVKALRLIQQADVVVFDRLVSDEILEMIPHGVSQISVGKTPGKHCVPQDQINEIIVSLALSGRRLVRLKGGDPYIFGRGGEEALVLRQHGIPFEVVPGVTAAAGCSSYSGIPLTHRGLNHGVRFITGHLQNDETLDIDWDKLADPDCTLVIYMGLANLQLICSELVRAGLPANTPAAAIHGGTTRHQQKVIATLSDLADAVDAADLESPVTTIIGDVVALSDELDWFQSEQQQNERVIADDSFLLARA